MIEKKLTTSFVILRVLINIPKNVQKDNGDDRDVKFHDFKGCLISQILISCKRCLKLRKTSIWSKVMERIF